MNDDWNLIVYVLHYIGLSKMYQINWQLSVCTCTTVIIKSIKEQEYRDLH